MARQPESQNEASEATQTTGVSLEFGFLKSPLFIIMVKWL